MPVPFRDDESAAESGIAAFLHVMSTADGFAGALFQIGARGEPIEFTWNQVTAPPSILWRPGDLRRSAIRLLAATVFETTETIPALLVVRGESFPAGVLLDDLQVSLPILSVSVSSDGEILHTWLSAPEAGSPATVLAELLAQRGLLLEPFERADEGLREVGESAHPSARGNPHPPAPSPGARGEGVTGG